MAENSNLLYYGFHDSCWDSFGSDSCSHVTYRPHPIHPQIAPLLLRHLSEVQINVASSRYFNKLQDTKAVATGTVRPGVTLFNPRPRFEAHDPLYLVIDTNRFHDDKLCQHLHKYLFEARMGSLMAGWDSRTEKFKKNYSFTKGEIDAYWRSKKIAEEEHLKAVSSPVDTTQDSEAYRRSKSMPAGNLSQIANDVEDTDIDKLFHGWWTSSNQAFLNEPPVLQLGR